MADVTIDVTEVRALEHDMRQVDSRLTRHLIPVVEKGAINVRDDMRQAAAGSRYFHLLPLTYDMNYPAGAIEAEVGPVKGGAASLANIAYFGGAHGGGRTIEDPQAAADREAPRFERALADVAADLVFG